MKKILKYHIVISISIFLIIYTFKETNQAISFLIGSGLVFLNLAILIWVWGRVISKKLIALAVSVIVIKYAIFGVIIYTILGHPEIKPLWFSLGLGTVVVTSLASILDLD